MSARGQLLADSAIAPGASYAYPATKVDFILGVNDTGEPVAGAHYLRSKLTTASSIQYVPGTPHAVFSTDAGAAAIEAAIEADCITRH